MKSDMYVITREVVFISGKPKIDCDYHKPLGKLAY